MIETCRLNHHKSKGSYSINLMLPVICKSNSPRSSRNISPQLSVNSCNLRSSSIEKSRLPDLKYSKNSGKYSTIQKTNQGKSSIKRCGAVTAFAVNSYPGKYRNEDRVSIMINIPKPQNLLDDSQWPLSSYYAIFDGHSGKQCAEYLKKNMYKYIINEPNFPCRIKISLLEGFKKLDQDFLITAKETGDMSGSCALALLVIGDKCFIANTGDSRAFISMNNGKAIGWLSNEHKPGDSLEYARILKAGGNVYSNYIINEQGENKILGPHLVSPGKLHVSRAFGDIDAKDSSYGGNPKVIIPDPEVKSFKMKKEQDFIVIATGCIYEKFSNREIVDIIFKNIENHKNEGLGVGFLISIQEIFNLAFSRMCEDNTTIIIIGLKGIQKYLNGLLH